MWRYESPLHWLELRREVYGPLQKAFGALDEAAKGGFVQVRRAL